MFLPFSPFHASHLEGVLGLILLLVSLFHCCHLDRDCSSYANEAKNAPVYILVYDS